MPRTSLFGAALLGVALTWLAPAEAQRRGLFRAVEAESARVARPPESRGVLTLRSRVVTIDLKRLEGARELAALRGSGRGEAVFSQADGRSAILEPATSLTLNLFDDAVFTAVMERAAPTFSGGYSLAGHLLEEPLGSVTLVVNGGTVAGSVRTPEGTYRIRSAGAGRYTVSEVEEPSLDCAVEQPLEGSERSGSVPPG